MTPKLRIIMQTINRSPSTAEALKQVAIEEGIDVVIMHAPPIYNNDIPGYTSSICTILTGVEDDEDITPQTAVAIFNQDLQLTSIPEMSDDTCIFLQLMTSIGEIYLISIHCPLKMDIISCLDKLQELLHFIGKKQVIICIDASAKSVWWSNSDSSDDRGEILEDFILANCLCVVNRRDPLGEHYKRNDYADVTLASSSILHRFTAWEAMDDCTSDETRTVGMEILLRNDENSPEDFDISEDNSNVIVDDNSNETWEDPRDEFPKIDQDHIPFAHTFPSELFIDEPGPSKEENKSLSEVRKESPEVIDKNIQELLKVRHKTTKGPDVKPSSVGSTSEWEEAQCFQNNVFI
ncbi:hypothetical protein TSAR_016437 [Trichomalopsis sarcophagae]|uniref:Endonuclease/exonuclease/phosphatase domain-containing protein n=1 Tax=Trichomalopsis sarcophagae TaxID=543379 RepID=A0A232EVX4_9HYME|nr:hypothetical protein TSAR_016437 [Trichomalopsis sarcophagae]